MAQRINNLATDHVWLIITVNKKSTSVRLLTPRNENKIPALGPNEFGYNLTITTNFKDWEDRFASYELPAPRIPGRPTLNLQNTTVGKSIEERVTDKLTL